MNTQRKINVLKLCLSKQEEGIYHVEAFIDGRPLAARDLEEIDIPFALLPSIDHDGDYFPVTCDCGDPGCAGYMVPITITHDGDQIHWTGRRPECDFWFERDQYRAEVLKIIDEGRAHVRERSPYFESINGHQNVDLFKSEMYQQALPELWAHAQRTRAEERGRGLYDES